MRYRRYKYYIFLNSSIKGPFWPNYMPPRWQWTQAYTDLLRGDVKAVGSSLVCLPEVDAGAAAAAAAAPQHRAPRGPPVQLLWPLRAPPF